MYVTRIRLRKSKTNRNMQTSKKSTKTTDMNRFDYSVKFVMENLK